MSNTIALLERIRETVPRQSKGSLGNALNIERGNLNQMYRRKRYPNALQMIAMAKILKMDAEEVAALVAEDKARTPATREEARRHAPRLPPAAAVALALIAGFSYDAHHSAFAGTQVADSVTEIYIMRTWRRLLRRLRPRQHLNLLSHLRDLAGPIPRVTAVA